jgi:hypothetical protein
MSRPALLYSRDLPGGGYVAIDARPVEHAAGAGDVPGGPAGAQPRALHSARLWVERRGDPSRRAGHTPPVIASATAPDLEHAVAELRAIAADNVALAQAMRRWARGVITLPDQP